MIWRPPGADYFGWLVGMQWPEGNEDRMWGLADDWRSAAETLNNIQADIDAAISMVQVAYPEGDGGAAMLEQLKQLKFGGDGGAGSVESLVTWFNSIADLAENTGTEFEYTKLMFHAMLLIMAVDMAIAAATLIGAPAAEAGVIAMNRLTARMIMKELVARLTLQSVKFSEIITLKSVLKAVRVAAISAGLGAGLGALPDAAIQVWQHENGRRKDINWEQTRTMAWAGAAGGLAAAGVFGALNVGMPANRITRVTTTGLTALAAGGAAAGAGWFTSGVLTDHWELDPRMITAGMWGGAGPGALRAVNPHLTTPSLPEGLGTPKSELAQVKPGTLDTSTDSGMRVGDTANPADSPAGARIPSDSPAGARLADSEAPVGDQRATEGPATRNEIGNTAVAGVQNAAPAHTNLAPSTHNSVETRAPSSVQSAGPAHTSGDTRTPADARPAPAPAPRADTPGSTTTPGDSTRAGAAPSKDTGGPSAPVQAKTTGAEATPRTGDKVEAAPTEQSGVPISERPEGTGPEARIGARPEDPTGGRESTPDGPSDRTPTDDEQPQPRQDESDRTPGRRSPHDPDSLGPADRVPGSALPDNRPITDAERVHAQEALNKLGHDADAQRLLHPDDTDQAGAHARAAENHAWWHSLTPDEQAAMVQTHPHQLGNADGIPPQTRDQANRLSIARDIAELRERNPRVDKWTSRFTDPEGRQQYKNLKSTEENIRLAEDLADRFAETNPDGGGHRPPVHVLSYDSTAFNGEGRAVVAFGNVDKASTVSWHIPGITTTVRSLEVNLNNAFNHYWATSDALGGKPAEVASIAWIGYDAPSGPRIGKEMTNTLLAERGGQLLARDVAAFNQTRKLDAALPGGAPRPDVHLFGHSYGSTTTGFAGAGGRLSGEVSTITLLGSPGAGPVKHASEFGIGDAVFAASSPRDPVTWVGSSTPAENVRIAPGLGMGLGLDPSVESFGARRIAAQFPGGTQTFSNVGTHTAYYKFHDGEYRQVPSESLFNFAKIAAGDEANLIPEYPRPDRSDLNGWQRNVGSLPRDPAQLRAAIHDPEEGLPYGYEDLMAEYRSPDPTPEPATLPKDHPPTNDCGPQALRQAQELTGNENIRVPEDPDIAQRGMSARDLEDAAGGRMDQMETHGVLADQLNRLGDGATALVVDEFHGPTDTNGVGAHAYTITNEGGRLIVHDSALEGGSPRPFPPDTTNVRATYAILYDSQGIPVRPVESVAPVRPGVTHPEARIGQHEPGHRPTEPENVSPQRDPVRSFDTHEAGKVFGEEALGPIRDTMTPTEIREMRRYSEMSWINEFLRHPDPAELLRTLSDDHRHREALMSLTDGKPIPPSVNLVDTVSQRPDLDPALRAAIDDVLSEPYPGVRLNQLFDNADQWVALTEGFGREPTIGALQEHIDVMDQVVNRPIPEGFQVVRGISTIGHLTVDQHGTPLLGGDPQQVVGTVQTEAGYMSTSVAPKPIQAFDRRVRMELDIHPDTTGLWLGDKSSISGENEFLLPRGTRYLITEVIESPPGSHYAGVDYVLKGVVVPSDFVPSPSARDHVAVPDHATLGQDVTPTKPESMRNVDDPADVPFSLLLDDEPKSMVPEERPGPRDPDPDATPRAPETPDDHHVPFQMGDDEHSAPRPEPDPVLDRPQTLTPHLSGRFDEMKSLASEIMRATSDPARATELPGLRRDFTTVLDRLGMMDRESAATPWRLLTEQDPAFSKFLGENHTSLIARPTETHAPNTPVGHPVSESAPRQESAHPLPDSASQHPLPAKETESGASFHPDDPALADLAGRIAEDPDHFTADVHITADGHARIGDRTYTPEEFGNLLRRTSWDGTTPIRLIGCDAATNGFASHLAAHLNTDVLAPTKPAWSDTRGNLYTSTAETNPGGTRRPRIPPDGFWETHHPNGTKTKATEDGFAPGTLDHDKHGLSPDLARDRSDEAPSEDPIRHSPDELTSHDPVRDVDDAYPDPEYTPVPQDETISPDDPRFGERFVEWNRPTHMPPDPDNPNAPRRPITVHDEISAPHRDRENVPDGNTTPDELKPIDAPEQVPEPLRDLAGNGPLRPWTAYPVVNENGTRTTFFTNGEGTVKWVEATPGAQNKAIEGKGKWSGFNPDLSYPLLPDAQYQVPNFHNNEKLLHFHTDKHGQTDSMTGDVEAGGQNKNYRDDDSNKGAQQRAYQEGEAVYPSDPSDRVLSPEEIEYARVRWAGGHLLANELGGLGEYLNMHGQMAASNSGNARDGWFHEPSWRAKEKDLVAFATPDHQEIRNYQVRMTREGDGVPSEVIMRWQEVTYARNEDGSVQLGPDNKPVVESVVAKERVFPNKPGVNYGPQTRYKNR